MTDAVADITLVTEGTYPYHHGGVTVWCDQLLRGLPERRFAVVAITGSGNEGPALELPSNVTSVAPVPLWGAPARRPAGVSGAARRSVLEAHDWLVSVLVDAAEDPEHELLGALGRLHELSATVDVASVLRSEEAIRQVHRSLIAQSGGARTPGGGLVPTVGDALAAGDLLEHFLRPLWFAPAPSGLVHCVSNGLPVLVALAAKWVHGTPMLLTEHGVYLRERYLAADSRAYTHPVRVLVLRFFRVLTGVGYRMADLITPGSEYNLRWQVNAGADAALIQPVHNGVDPMRFPPAGAEPEVPTISWVGRVDPLKDLETLIRAFAIVRDEIPDARLRMFGATPAGNESYRKRCEALVERLDLAGSATFEGRVADITDAYRAGQIVALTSVSEGFPYSVIEAMASQRATVSTDVGGVREAVGEAGLIVTPRDAEQFAAACVRLLRNRKLRRRMAGRARARVLDRFTLAQFLGIYREIYRDLIAPPAVHRGAGVPTPDRSLSVAEGIA